MADEHDFDEYSSPEPERLTITDRIDNVLVGIENFWKSLEDKQTDTFLKNPFLYLGIVVVFVIVRVFIF